MAAADVLATESRDYYEVLGADPSASSVQLRTAFREAVLRHHPDRAASSEVATRRTSILNRAWAELRDPVRRLHYDHDLENGRAATFDWPLEEGERQRAPRRAHRRHAPAEPSPWHEPRFRSVAGFRVPAEVVLAGPAAQDRWIIEHHIAGQDWREHSERYWLRYAARHYAERGRIDDQLGALERMVAQDVQLAEIVDAGLRDAYLDAGAAPWCLPASPNVTSRAAPSDDGPSARCACCSANIARRTCGVAPSRSAPRTPSCC
jgi:curved DNA-binding protein CbpA